MGNSKRQSATTATATGKTHGEQVEYTVTLTCGHTVTRWQDAREAVQERAADGTWKLKCGTCTR